MSKPSKKKNKSLFWRAFFAFQIAILLGTVGLVVIFFAITNGLFGTMPTFEDIKNPSSILATEVYTSDGELLGKFFIENRTELDYADLPPHLVQALIATEDVRFHSHPGIDARGLTRAVIKGLLGQSSGGASTITQQLAKNLYHKPADSKVERIQQKLKEWVIAVQLEKNFTKEEIIAIYFNTVPYVYNAYGLKAACLTYLNKNPQDLNIQEAALMVGMLKNPALYNPRTRYDLTKERRNVVLAQMYKYGYIDKALKDSLQQTEIELNFQSSYHTAGVAPYFRSVLSQELKSILGNPTYYKPDGSQYDIYRDGLKVYTTLDYDMQVYAEEAVEEHLSELQETFFAEWSVRTAAAWEVGARANPDLINECMRKTPRYQSLKEDGKSEEEIKEVFNNPVGMTIFTWQGDKDTMMTPMDSIRYYNSILQVGFMVMEPSTGAIKAWVGGSDFRYFKYDHVKKTTKRQVGSTIKPILYATALQSGLSPCFRLPYEAPMIPGFESWDPKPHDEWEEGELVRLQDYLANSSNRGTAQVVKMIGIDGFIRNCAALGLENMNITPANPDYGPAIALGTRDISVYEMVGAYGAFANQGIYSEPYYIQKITDKDGNIIYENRPDREEVLDKDVAYTTVYMLEKVVDEGTARRLRGTWKEYGGFTNPIAGKTGTTQGNADAWFIGMTPELVAGVWVGCDNPSVSFATTAMGQGANAALPVWARFFKKLQADSDMNFDWKKDFSKPKDLAFELDCEKHYQNPFE
jgi:penicillin-binding protein 1A